MVLTFETSVTTTARVADLPLFNDDVVTLALRPGDELCGHLGQVWCTVNGRHEDFILRRGDRLVARQRETVHLSGMDRGTVRLTAAPRKQARWRRWLQSVSAALESFDPACAACTSSRC